LISDLLRKISQLTRTKDAVLIAIDGVGGAGKTTLAEFLKKQLANCMIVQLDDFYSPTLHAADLLRLKKQVLLPLHEHRKTNYQIGTSWNRSEWLSSKGFTLSIKVFALIMT
jgi:pantothenate kinase-related protein Tda10